MSEPNCPYIIYKLSKSCANCTGYRCTSAGREKKVDKTQLETCRDINEYVLCTRYIENLPVDVLETIEPIEEPVEEEQTISYIGGVDFFDPAIPDIEETVSTPEPTPVTTVPCVGCGNHSIRVSDCKYQGPPPAGMTSCLGLWCYGRNKNIRIDRTCVAWQECSVYLMSKWKGVPFYDE